MNGYDLVAFDLDGTLVGDDLRVRPRVAETIAKMQQRGVQGCIVTGRMYRAALPFVRGLRFTAPVICYQGACVVDPQTDAVLCDVPLPNAHALAVEAYAREHGLHVQLYAQDRYYCERYDRYAALYARISGVEPILVPSLRERFEGCDATKAVIIAEPETVAAHIAPLKSLCGPAAYVTRSIARFLEVVNSRVDKGRSLELVAGRLGIAMDRVMAVGDSWNDEPLLRSAGFGVAMGSAPSELLELADAVVTDVASDGAAEAVERFVLA